ncbi:PepSY domain-containing protein [Nostoc sp.]|uniref:PepSY domain-containing protein n=1 Tax=Nostoc sp. TaxID=1180 RepID=UPI002FFA61A7
MSLGIYYVGDCQGDLENDFELPSYFRTDAAIFYKQGQLRTQINFRNLFNIDYFEQTQNLLRVYPGEPFDVHKVAGVVAVVFLIFTFFTGFCWSYAEFVNLMIYAVTFSQKQADPVSVPLAGKSALGLKEQLKTAQAALPDASLRRIDFPSKLEEVLTVSFKLP